MADEAGHAASSEAQASDQLASQSQELRSKMEQILPNVRVA